MLIREFSTADRDGVFPLAEALAMSFDVERQPFERVFDQLLAEDNCTVFVAEEDDQLVGYVLGLDHPTFFANGRVAWVEELFVLEAHRRKGVAAALMEAFEMWSKARGCALIALGTRSASDFYNSIGYTANAEYFSKKF